MAEDKGPRSREPMTKRWEARSDGWSALLGMECSAQRSMRGCRGRGRERESEVLGEEERNGQSQNWMSSLPLCCLAPPLLSLSPSLLWFFPLSHTHATTTTTQTWLAGWLASSASGVQDFRTQLGRSPLLLLFCGRLGVNFFFLFFFLLNDPHLFFLRLCSSPHDVVVSSSSLLSLCITPLIDLFFQLFFFFF
ncbi:hypothetical protein HDK77DRAFT_131413 [Phyllosticta capitalensis]